MGLPFPFRPRSRRKAAPVASPGEQARRPRPAPPQAGVPDPARAQSEADLLEARTAQARLRKDLAELESAHRQQARLLERNQNAYGEVQKELDRSGARVQALEAELASAEQVRVQQAARERELAEQLGRLPVLEEEQKSLVGRLADAGRHLETLQAERDRLTAELVATHATLAAKDAETIALKASADEWKVRVLTLNQDLLDERTNLAQLKVELERAAEKEAGHTRLRLEYDALAARWEVARAQLAEAEEAFKLSQATIKAAHRLSSSMEWRTALDSVLDAASEMVRFERGTLALVDEVQEELKIEAARNSPIAVSEMSRFKVGEGIAGWALSHREPVLVQDSRSDPRFKASDPTHKPRSFIAVPLMAGEERLGVLTLARSASDPFDEHDLRNLARVGNDAATALTNARLVHVLRQREDELTELVQKSKELWAARDISQVVQFVLKSARELVGGRAALLALQDAKSHELEVIGSLDVPELLLEHGGNWGAPAALDVMRSGKPWVAPMRDILPTGLVDRVEAAGIHGMISVPCGVGAAPSALEDTALLSRSEPVSVDDVAGVLHVYQGAVEPISSSQLEQLKAYADQASVAIKNIRRWETVKEQLQTAASLNTRLMGRERYIHQLHFRIQQLEEELERYKAA